MTDPRDVLLQAANRLNWLADNLVTVDEQGRLRVPDKAAEVVRLAREVTEL